MFPLALSVNVTVYRLGGPCWCGYHSSGEVMVYVVSQVFAVGAGMRVSSVSCQEGERSVAVRV